MARDDGVDGVRRGLQIGDVERRREGIGYGFATSSARRRSRPLIPTIAPAAARPRAISSPSPRVAPVTSATRPASEKRSSPDATGRVIDRVPDNRLLHPYDSHQHPQGLSGVRLRQPRRGAAGRLGRVRAGQAAARGSRRSSASTPTAICCYINGRVVPAARERSNAAEVGWARWDKKEVGKLTPGTAAWQEKFGRLLGCRDPHARLSDMDALGTDQVMLFPTWFVRLALVRSPEAATVLARAYNDWVLDYCAADRRRLFPCAVLPLQSVEASIAELQARRQARLQGGRGAAVLLERPLSHVARVRSALARVRGLGRRARHAHVSLARGADARMGPAHGPGARALRAGAPVHRRGGRLLARASSSPTSPRRWIRPSTPPRRSAS